METSLKAHIIQLHAKLATLGLNLTTAAVCRIDVPHQYANVDTDDTQRHCAYINATLRDALLQKKVAEDPTTDLRHPPTDAIDLHTFHSLRLIYTNQAWQDAIHTLTERLRCNVRQRWILETALRAAIWTKCANCCHSLSLYDLTLQRLRALQSSPSTALVDTIQSDSDFETDLLTIAHLCEEPLKPATLYQKYNST